MPDLRLRLSATTPARILADVIAEHKPISVFAGFSGGHDSLVSTHCTMEHAPQMTDVPVRVLHINTGIGIRQTREFVRETCAAYDWPLWERHAAKGEYERFVVQHGFPGPGQHARMYQRLKQRVVEAVLREVKVGHPRSARILFVTGIYADESRIRAGYNRAVSKRRADVWANPLYWWRRRDFDDYRQRHVLPTNPVKELYGHSGECLCGAFADYGEACLLREHYPEAWADIERLEKLAAANGKPWRWADPGPSRAMLAEQRGQITLDFRPLCHGCGKDNAAAPDA
jgi:3'-phosphoadenosine 5'-phosphosulfate sulfotransferase (PAPS reductase)/FAD synthetase